MMKNITPIKAIAAIIILFLSLDIDAQTLSLNKHELNIFDTVYVHNFDINPPRMQVDEGKCFLVNAAMSAGGYGKQYGRGCGLSRVVLEYPEIYTRANASTRFWLEGDNSQNIEVNWNYYSQSYNNSFKGSSYRAYSTAMATLTLEFEIQGVQSGTLVNVWFDYDAYAAAFHIEDGPGDEATITSGLEIEGIDLYVDGGHTMNFHSPPGSGGFNSVIDGGIMNVIAGTPFTVVISGQLKTEVLPGGEDFGFGFEKDRATANYRGSLILSLDTVPTRPPNVLGPNDLGLFSTDIGGGSSISDPMPNGTEYFDPGDAYSFNGSRIPQGGEDGIIDDLSFTGGTDLAPNPPDPTIPPLTAVPLFGGFLDPFAFTDIDGIDLLDFQLLDPSNPIYFPSNQPGLKSIEHLFLSFDDDLPDNYSHPMVSIPATSFAPFSNSMFGTKPQKDEIVEAYVSPIRPNEVQSIYGVYSEEDIHVNLGPNPIPHADPFIANLEDDDIDALDFSEGIAINPYVYLSVDHEASGHHTINGLSYDPGIIYRIASPMTLEEVINHRHTGLTPGVDINAFEFALIPDSQTPFNLYRFCLLFSVDVDDPGTSEDESGGLHPAKLYGSYMNGTHFEIDTGFVFPDNIDAISTWDKSLNGTIPVISSIRDFNSQDSFSIFVFPNPSNEFITIQVSDRNRNTTTNYQIISEIGKLIQEGVLISNRDQIQISGLSSGVYLLVLKEGIKKRTARFIVH